MIARRSVMPDAAGVAVDCLRVDYPDGSIGWLPSYHNDGAPVAPGRRRGMGFLACRPCVLLDGHWQAVVRIAGCESGRSSADMVTALDVCDTLADLRLLLTLAPMRETDR